MSEFVLIAGLQIAQKLYPWNSSIAWSLITTEVSGNSIVYSHYSFSRYIQFETKLKEEKPTFLNYLTKIHVRVVEQSSSNPSVVVCVDSVFTSKGMHASIHDVLPSAGPSGLVDTTVSARSHTSIIWTEGWRCTWWMIAFTHCTPSETVSHTCWCR
jgi:hypothetical protein